MIANKPGPVLIVGGSGFVGSRFARLLRTRQPVLPIAIGGRDLARAQRVAEPLGHASAYRIDLSREDLGLDRDDAFSAVVMFVKDERLSGLRFAQTQGIPYIDISTGAFEIAPLVAFHVQRPERSAVLLASHWLAGAATLATLELAREFQSLESIAIGAVLDEQDIGGPAAAADFERILAATSGAPVLADGRFRWLSETDSTRDFRTLDGTLERGRAYASVLDVQSLAARTSARSIRLDVVVGESAGRRRGEPFSTEMIIELTGRRSDGKLASARHELTHPEGQAPITALAVGLALERLLGLAGGTAARPGLYMPEALLEPKAMITGLIEVGTQVRRGAAGEV